MVFGASNHNKAVRENSRCAMCGAAISSTGGRSLDQLCLICRAAILDRIFQARRQHAHQASSDALRDRHKDRRSESRHGVNRALVIC